MTPEQVAAVHEAANAARRDALEIRRAVNRGSRREDWLALRLAVLALKALSIGFKLDGALGIAYTELARYVARKEGER